MFYLITITGATLLIALINFIFGDVHTWLELGSVLLWTSLGTVSVIAVDGLFAFVIRRLPEKWFAPEAKAFSVPKWEKNLYRKTKINVWKKHVPEWGCFTGFHKDALKDAADSQYIGRFLLESNYGVLGHIAGALFGFLILFLPFLHPLRMALPIAIINGILSLLPTMILRFNTPPLLRLYHRSLSKNAKTERTNL